ncbi:hypothetical protein CRG98_001455 [Punica granatum]|uniref:Uncharacterized protein n=1 Tax=Punica granatum TaxID=22663 RepID=A0A2I0LBS6_PUNGR|nr:hypothetical protein CRG98_001455 [Punica granatum]
MVDTRRSRRSKGNRRNAVSEQPKGASPVVSFRANEEVRDAPTRDANAILTSLSPAEQATLEAVILQQGQPRGQGPGNIPRQATSVFDHGDEAAHSRSASQHC